MKLTEERFKITQIVYSFHFAQHTGDNADIVVYTIPTTKDLILNTL